MISRAHAEVKELRQSIDLLKAEGEKLEVKLYIICYGSSLIEFVLFNFQLFHALTVSIILLKTHRIKSLALEIFGEEFRMVKRYVKD